MATVAKIKPPDEAFNSYAAYQRERDYSARLETLLAKALDLLSMETGRRKLRGEDVAHLEAFVASARKVWS